MMKLRIIVLFDLKPLMETCSCFVGTADLSKLNCKHLEQVDFEHLSTQFCTKKVKFIFQRVLKTEGETYLLSS